MSAFVTIFIVLSFLEIAANYARTTTTVINGEDHHDEFVDVAGYGEEKLSTVVISGKLLCHDGTQQHASSHPHPISGASLAVFCSGTKSKTKKSWAKGITNSYGEFLIDLPSHLHAIIDLEKVCLVRVLQLPKSSPCEHAFTGKRKGIKLESVGEGVRAYTTSSIHLITKPSQAIKRGADKRQII